MTYILIFEVQKSFNIVRCEVISFTDDMSREVVVSVDWVGPLSAVLVHDHGSEIFGEQLVVGP